MNLNSMATESVRGPLRPLQESRDGMRDQVSRGAGPILFDITPGCDRGGKGDPRGGLSVPVLKVVSSTSVN